MMPIISSSRTTSTERKALILLLRKWDWDHVATSFNGVFIREEGPCHLFGASSVEQPCEFERMDRFWTSQEVMQHRLTWLKRGESDLFRDSAA